MNDKLPKWLSFHIHLPWTGNEFLTDFLPPLISGMKIENQIKRFFFIRYNEGGYHLRLRLRTTARSDGRAIERRLKNALQNFRRQHRIPASQVRLTSADYSRAAHYFDETRESVYAELINEQTSRLSMQMLAGDDERKNSRLLKNIASVYWLFTLSAFNENDLTRSLAESREFAELNRAENKREFSGDELLRMVTITIGRTSANIDKLSSLTRAARLLKRLKLHENGRFAATHAIHLYCNKLGFSISQESEIYSLLDGTPKPFVPVEK